MLKDIKLFINFQYKEQYKLMFRNRRRKLKKKKFLIQLKRWKTNEIVKSLQVLYTQPYSSLI